MESCVLCLEINKDILDCIKANSARWEELDIANTIEKHFWSMNTIQPSSWICLSCWREVNDFHKFYLRIDEAHKDFGKIKLEDEESAAAICKEELPSDKDNMTFCFMEPEILIDQTKPQDLAEPEILMDQPSIGPNNETPISEHLDERDLDDMPLKEAGKSLRLQNDMARKDPLEKSKKSTANKSKRRKYSKAIASAEEIKVQDSKVKDEPVELNYNNDSDCVTDNDNGATDANYQPDKNYSLETVESKRRKAYSKHRTNRKENDQFIAEHFNQMFCDLCQVPFDDFPAMQKHFVENHQQRGYVVCCKRKFFDRTRLVDHLHCHLNPDHFKCNECGKAMSDRNNFDSHMIRVHRANEVVKQHCCDVCGKSFTEAYMLRIHKLTHLPEEEKKFPCSDCGKNYGSPYVLNRHRQAVHLKRFVKICYICGKAINSSAEFKLHMNKHEGIPLPVVNCDVCGLRLTSERGLKLHKESQHPVGGKQEHHCTICSKISPTLKALKKHMNKHEDIPLPVVNCDVCGLRLTSKRGLKLHKESQHPVGGKQEHHCPICPKISPTLKALRKHIDTMHKKGYDRKCSFCEKAFKRPEGLREHVASQHTGTALYTCPWCPQTFNSNGNMHSHRKKMHPKEWLESKLQKYSGNIPPEI